MLIMPLTRTQIDHQLGCSIEGSPIYIGRGDKPLHENLDYIEVVMNEGDYSYRLDILSRNAAHFGSMGGSGVSCAQLQMWDYRYEWWGEIATNLKNFIKKVKRMNLNKDMVIENPTEQNLFRTHQEALDPLIEKINEDLGKMGNLRLRNMEFLQNLEKEEKERDRNPDPQRQPGQGASAPKTTMRPVDSLKPSHALNYKMSIPEKDIWKESILARFEASGFENTKQPIQIQFLHQVIRDEMLKAVQHQFRPEHGHNELI